MTETRVRDKLNGINYTTHSRGPMEQMRHEFNTALNFALDEVGSEGLEFLRAWREGNTGNDWPEWEAYKEKHR